MIFDFDLVIVGGGAAGLRAALSAAKINPKLKIAIISKVYPIRSHTVSAEGGISGVLREYDNFEEHAYDTVKGGDFLADQDIVEIFVERAPKEIIQMEHWGCPWSRDPSGRISVRAFGGMSKKRTVFAADKTGFYMLHTLFERTLKHENILRFDEFFATELIVDGEQIRGLIALDLRRGQFCAFNAKAVILATGGAGKTYNFTSNGSIKTGDGMALAYEAGAFLKDMEFVQFHPTGLPRTGILITEAARGEGGYLINREGERFMKKYLPQKMELGPRDIIARSIMKEIHEGRGFAGEDGDYVLLDIRHLGEKTINEKLPQVREIAKDFAGIDPVTDPIPVRPVCHYFMGGVDTNAETETALKGLYAAGETACLSINGANRLGSNSLSECLVFGAIAGEKAAEFASSMKTDSHESASHSALERSLHEEENRIAKMISRDGTGRVASVRESLQQNMDQNAGIERSGESLKKGLQNLEKIKEKFADIALQDKSQIFNLELTSILELDNMLTVSEAVLRSAILREESRGSHFRTDFQFRDDEKFLKHLLVSKSTSGMIMHEEPITITKWKPEERKY